MPRTMLKNKNWTRLRLILLELNIYDKGNLRRTVEGVLYRMRTGCPWRDLPRYFGKPNTVYKAYQRWFRSNKLVQLFALLIKESDLEWVFIDGTHIKAHQHSSGGNESVQAISKSVAGGLNNIPKKRNTKTDNNHMDWNLYKARHLVENAFAHLKRFRAVATGYDKLKQSYENTVALACAFIWLKL